MKSSKRLDHCQEHICKIWFDDVGYHVATQICSELIRCKDCIHNLQIGTEMYCIDSGIRTPISAYDYCSRAEKEKK